MVACSSPMSDEPNHVELALTFNVLTPVKFHPGESKRNDDPGYVSIVAGDMAGRAEDA